MLLIQFYTNLLFLYEIIKSQIVNYEKHTVYKRLINKDSFTALDKNSEMYLNIKIKTEIPNQLAFYVIGERIDLQNNLKEVYSCSIKPNNFERIEKNSFNFDLKNEDKLVETIHIDQPGLYKVFFIACADKIEINGRILFKGSCGYLSGHLCGYLSFFNNMMVLYIITIIFWIIVLIIQNQKLFVQHHLLTAELILNFLEVILSNISYHNHSKTGSTSSTLLSFSIFFGIFRKTGTRVLLILICSGYGITNKEITSNMKLQLYKFASIYSALNLTTFSNTVLVPINESLFYKFCYFIIIVVDTIVYVWVFVKMTKTIYDLKCKELYYLRLYKKFFIVICLSFFSSFIFILLKYNRKSKGFDGTNWKNFWWYDRGYWILQHFIVLIAIMYLWRPLKEKNYRKISMETENLRKAIFENSSNKQKYKINKIPKKINDLFDSNEEKQKKEKSDNEKSDNDDEKNDIIKKSPSGFLGSNCSDDSSVDVEDIKNE